MNELFLKIINMSIAASWLVLAVLILRLVLKKAPKWVNVLLWGIVAVRLICPFSIESAFSLMPSVETIPMNIEMDTTPTIDINAINNVVNPIISQSNTPVNGASINPLQITVAILENIWILGVAALLIYTVISYWRLRRKVDTAVIYRENILQSENVSSPFVLGFIKPRIYLPFKMTGQDLEHVVSHEQAHIRRKDHWWKPIGFLLLTIHWFNPLMWLAYVLLCRDIEIACDEKVIKDLGCEQRADYTQALVSCSVNRRMIAACPLAFGEVGVKERVKSIMNYKKPAFWVVILTVIICVIVALCFLTDPIHSKNDDTKEDGYHLLIGAEGVLDIKVSTPNTSGGCRNADGSPYKKGEEVWLEQLSGVTDLRGVIITALDKNEEILYTFSVPYDSTNEEITKLVGGDSWLIAPTEIGTQEANFAELEQYRTDYIGDAVKVSSIAQLLPYPNGYAFSSIELQTSKEPYELIVYLNGEGDVQKEDFESCATMAFNLIGNMGIISFCDADSQATIASFTRMDCEKNISIFQTGG